MRCRAERLAFVAAVSAIVAWLGQWAGFTVGVLATIGYAGLAEYQENRNDRQPASRP